MKKIYVGYFLDRCRYRNLDERLIERKNLDNLLMKLKDLDFSDFQDRVKIRKFFREIYVVWKKD